jgi:hypothetical protein
MYMPNFWQGDGMCDVEGAFHRVVECAWWDAGDTSAQSLDEEVI